MMIGSARVLYRPLFCSSKHTLSKLLFRRLWVWENRWAFLALQLVMLCLPLPCSFPKKCRIGVGSSSPERALGRCGHFQAGLEVQERPRCHPGPSQLQCATQEAWPCGKGRGMAGQGTEGCLAGNASAHPSRQPLALPGHCGRQRSLPPPMLTGAGGACLGGSGSAPLMAR